MGKSPLGKGGSRRLRGNNKGQLKALELAKVDCKIAHDNLQNNENKEFVMKIKKLN